MAQRIFTPVEANRTLPLVRKVVADVLEAGRELRVLQANAVAPGSEAEARADELTNRLDDLFTELSAVGCSFRSPDFEFGLVDFPAVIDEVQVLLCWKDDEPDVRYYHEPGAGFAGRRPIPAELLAPTARAAPNA